MKITITPEVGDTVRIERAYGRDYYITITEVTNYFVKSEDEFGNWAINIDDLRVELASGEGGGGVSFSLTDNIYQKICEDLEIYFTVRSKELKK